MKKVLVVLLILAVAGGLFAEVNISTWGRGMWVPFVTGSSVDDKGTDATEADDVKISGNGMNIGPNFGKPVRAGLSFSGTNEAGTVGYNLDLDQGSGDIGVGDNLKVWASPIPQLKLTVGRFYEDKLRGGGYTPWFDTVGFGDGYFNAPDQMFSRRASLQGADIAVSVAGFDAYASFTVNGMNYTTAKDGLMDVFKFGQYGVGYTVPDIVQIKAQYIGGLYTGTPDEIPDSITGNQRDSWIPIRTQTNKIEFAAKILALGDLGVIELGGKYLFAYTQSGVTFTPGFQFRAGGNLNFGDIGVVFSGGFKGGDKYTGRTAGDAEITGSIEPTYNLADMGLTIGVPVSMHFSGDYTKHVNFGVRGTKDFSGLGLGFGVVAQIDLADDSPALVTGRHFKADPLIAIPIVFDVSF
jgi:hypothetical protein